MTAGNGPAKSIDRQTIATALYWATKLFNQSYQLKENLSSYSTSEEHTQYENERLVEKARDFQTALEKALPAIQGLDQNMILQLAYDAERDPS